MARIAARLMLLGSPPDMVHSALPHRTRTPHDQIERLYYIIITAKNQVL